MGCRSQPLELRSCQKGDRGTKLFLLGQLQPEYTSVCFIDNIYKAVYKKRPDLTREGGSIPVTITFAERLGVNVLLLPMGRGDDGAQ